MRAISPRLVADGLQLRLDHSGNWREGHGWKVMSKILADKGTVFLWRVIVLLKAYVWPDGLLSAERHHHAMSGLRRSLWFRCYIRVGSVSWSYWLPRTRMYSPKTLAISISSRWQLGVHWPTICQLHSWFCISTYVAQGLFITTLAMCWVVFYALVCHVKW